MSFEDIIYEKNDGIARITINRPKVLNAFRSKTLDELAEAFDDAEGDGAIGVVVITDISEMGELNSSAGRVFLRKCLKTSTAIRNCSKPVIAMVRGYCLGGGHEIHLMCDLTIAAESAKFGQTGPTVGSVPVWGGTQMLPRVVGEKKAREIVFLCNRYTAEEAVEMGLVNKAVPDDRQAGRGNHSVVQAHTGNEPAIDKRCKGFAELRDRHDVRLFCARNRDAGPGVWRGRD
jgi:1,4-dihydroxy-2-naphthoyl-CoA synthase